MLTRSGRLAVAFALVHLQLVDAAFLLQTGREAAAPKQILRSHAEDGPDAPILATIDHKTRPLAKHLHNILLQLGGARVQSFFSKQIAQQAPDTPDIVIEDPAPAWTFAWLQAMVLLPTFLFYVGLASAVAYFYYRQKPVLEGALPALVDSESLEWTAGFCDCCSTPGICLWAWCCPCIRWADTISMTGLLGFWMAFTIYLGLTFAGSVTAEGLLWILLSVICAGFRQEMRIKFHMKNKGGMTYFQDCLLYCCCPICAITQEARHVEDACKVGQPVEVATANATAFIVPAATDGAGGTQS